MKRTIRVLAAVLAILMLSVIATACGDDDVVIVEPSDSDTPKTTVPTKIYEDGKMSASYLIAVYGSDMSWYDVAGYDHAEETAGTAVFPIDCGDKEDGSLTVVYDPETGAISEADLLIDGKHIDLLVDDREVLAEIRSALFDN